MDVTLPETNSLPLKNGWLEYYFCIGFWRIFRGYVKLQGGLHVGSRSGARQWIEPGDSGDVGSYPRHVGTLGLHSWGRVVAAPWGWRKDGNLEVGVLFGKNFSGWKSWGEAKSERFSRCIYLICMYLYIYIWGILYSYIHLYIYLFSFSHIYIYTHISKDQIDPDGLDAGKLSCLSKNKILKECLCFFWEGCTSWCLEWLMPQLILSLLIIGDYKQVGN